VVEVDGVPIAPPGLLNALEVQRALQAEYMRGARPMANSSIPSPSGTAYFWLWIDATGKVTDRQLERSSGYAVLDQAAARVLDVLRLRAAFRQGCAVSAWVLWPITFRVIRIGGEREIRLHVVETFEILIPRSWRLLHGPR
jgi:TonB family protein